MKLAHIRAGEVRPPIRIHPHNVEAAGSEVHLSIRLNAGGVMGPDLASPLIVPHAPQWVVVLALSEIFRAVSSAAGIVWGGSAIAEFDPAHVWIEEVGVALVFWGWVGRRLLKSVCRRCGHIVDGHGLESGWDTGGVAGHNIGHGVVDGDAK